MKSALIMGMQTSGISAKALLEKRGVKVSVYDDNLDIVGNLKGKPPEEILEGIDVVVVSPSVPSDHELVTFAESKGIPVRSELDVGIGLLDAKTIMVTGTNGKTTVVDMITKGLTIMGKKAIAMGNIGLPVTQVVYEERKPDYAVIEASSFQLEKTYCAGADVAVLLNIAPDHIDRYKSYNDYINAKKNVFQNRTSHSVAIVGYDSRLTREIGKELTGDVRFISVKEEIGTFYLKDNYYYFKGEPLISARESRIKGEHNKFNFIAAMNVMYALGGKREQFCSLIRDYKLLPHRVEFVGMIGKKCYYNDSKGTNIHACRSAIDALGGRIGLILGGSDKHEEFYDFFEDISDKVSYVVVSGSNEEKIYAAALKVGYSSICIAPSLQAAIDKLSAMREVDTILFSPASASFDRYSNYMERGDKFKELVYAIKA